MFKFRHFLVCITFLTLTAADPFPDGKNVCSKVEIVTRYRAVEEPVQVEIKVNDKCGFLFDCEKTVVQTRKRYPIKKTTENVVKYICCQGYQENDYGICEPVCETPCQNGKCVRPNVCQCSPEATLESPGYLGLQCSRYACLLPNRWGPSCENECNCTSLNSYCQPTTGTCLCRPGWRGPNCLDECTSTMNCDDVKLPPVIDLETNLITNTIGTSQRLEARNSMLDDEDNQTNSSKFTFSLLATHMGLNLFLIVLASGLFFSLFVYRKKLRALREQIYYPPSSQSGSNYTDPSDESCISNRPPMPLPGESNYLSKNLSFATVTRNILNKDTPRNDINYLQRSKVILDENLEKHLINNQVYSVKNIYTDLSSSIDKTKPVIVTSRDDSCRLNLSREEDHEYQVPKSRNFSHDDKLLDCSSIQDDKESNIYEEIKPRGLNDE